MMDTQIPETHWSRTVAEAVQEVLPKGTVFVLAVGTPEEALPDGSQPVDFQILTNSGPEYAKQVMRTLGREPKDQLDHALDLYRHPDTARIGATFEDCLEFVKAVDGEADRRRLKDWLDKPRPIRSHEGDQEVQP